MDTRFWGPDGWKLLHSVAAGYPDQPDIITKQLYRNFFESLQLILPCIYCRNSFEEYIQQLPVRDHLQNRQSLSYWMYQMHNKVNEKLEGQDLPVLFNRDFTGIYKYYQSYVKGLNTNTRPIQLTPGFDFLYCVLFNYPTRRNFKEKEPRRAQGYIDFLYSLALVIPFKELRLAMQRHLERYPLINKETGITHHLTRGFLKQWVHQLEKDYKKQIQINCPKYGERCYTMEFFRAGCNGKNDPKPTCHVSYNSSTSSDLSE